MTNTLFRVIPPHTNPVPILVSAPHVGTAFPPELQNFQNSIMENPEDTDWLVHELYGFASGLGITIIHPHYSRYVIDLNRDPDSHPLYNDARRETGLIPMQTFSGKQLYKTPELAKAANQAEERERRKQKYYWPYYNEIEQILARLQRNSPHVLFFDAHSIRAQVDSIQKEPFPDLILGNQKGKTAAPALSETAHNCLSHTDYTYSYNEPFQGGHLTRYFGRPEKRVHALQLEMSQAIYLSSDRIAMDRKKLPKIEAVLRELFKQLIITIEKMP